jgi:hypothetical protein
MIYIATQGQVAGDGKELSLESRKKKISVGLDLKN